MNKLEPSTNMDNISCQISIAVSTLLDQFDSHPWVFVKCEEKEIVDPYEFYCHELGRRLIPHIVTNQVVCERYDANRQPIPGTSLHVPIEVFINSWKISKSEQFSHLIRDFENSQALMRQSKETLDKTEVVRPYKRARYS